MIDRTVSDASCTLVPLRMGESQTDVPWEIVGEVVQQAASTPEFVDVAHPHFMGNGTVPTAASIVLNEVKKTAKRIVVLEGENGR